MTHPELYITPHWPAPKTIRAYTSTRINGYSAGAHASFNLSNAVEDDPEKVEQNRAKLKQDLHLPEEPYWLTQVHGTQVIELAHTRAISPEADASIACTANQICTILTADCMPILLSAVDGTEVAAIHAGWKGLLAGIIDTTIAQMKTPSQSILAWLGPALGPDAFEVNEDIQKAYVARDNNNKKAFRKNHHRLLADFYLLAKNNLCKLGIQHIFGGNFCTFSDEKRFYSFRRDQGKTGRMASLIWISQAAQP